MELQVADQQQQWHVAIGLADFVTHVSNLQHIVDMCNTMELGSIDRAKLKNIMQWGLFIEQMMESLTTDSQRDALARALASLSTQGSWHSATLARLRQEPSMLGTFVEDTAELVVAHGRLAVLSSAYSTLLVCADNNELVSFAPSSGSDGKTTRQRPCTYEMSVETTQKRAYARNCYDQMLSEYNQRETGVLRKRATSFIDELAQVSRKDAVALEVMCLALLEPWRRISEADSSLTTDLLTQVLTFRDDVRLWSMDKWLLGELSHRYESFARVYVHQVVHSRNGRNDIKRKELDGEDIRGLRSTEDIHDRLDFLASRSESLKDLVSKVAGSNYVR